MKGQPCELVCRGGSLLVNESRVVRRGTVAWALWQSQIIGVGCTCPDATRDDATVYLHLRDGRCFAAEQLPAHQSFQLFELLGYDPEPEPEPEDDTNPRPGDTPLVIDLGDGHTRVVISAQSVTVEQDKTPLWVAPRDHVLGVRVTAGPDAATVQVAARNGGATLLENVPFAAALRLLVALGALPAEFASLASPDAPALSPAHAYMSVPPANNADTALPTSAAAPAGTQSRVRAESAGAAQATASSPRPAVRARGEPPPKARDAQGRLSTERARSGVPPRSRQPRERPRPRVPAASLSVAPARPPQVRYAAHDAAQAKSPKPAKPSGTASSARAQQPPAAGTRAKSRPRASDAPRTPPGAARPGGPAPTRATASAPAPASATTDRPRVRQQSQPQAGASPVATAATQRQVPRDETVHGGRVAVADASDAVDAAAGTSASPNAADADTMPQAALLLRYAALAAVALRLAEVRHMLAAMLRLPTGLWAGAGVLAPARGLARQRVVPPSQAPLQTRRVTLVRIVQTDYHRLGAVVATLGAVVLASVGSATRAARNSAPSPWSLPRDPSQVQALVTSTHTRAAPRALPSMVAVRWRQRALVAVFAVLALSMAGDARVAHPAPASHSGTVVSHRTTVAPAQAEIIRPSRAVVLPAVPAGVVYAGPQDGAIYVLDAHAGTLIWRSWRYSTGSPVEGGPVVAGFVVYAVSGDSSVFALDAHDGSMRWTYRTNGRSASSPAMVAAS